MKNKRPDRRKNSAPNQPAISPKEAAEQATVERAALEEALQGIAPEPVEITDAPHLTDKVKTLLIGKPRDLADSTLFHSVSLVAFMAWVGLGADGLSSSSYGPSEAFHQLGEHAYLAVFLALATVFTVWVISACYSHIIEEFPSGGGGYLVASKLLGRPVGVVSGCALVVDYVLTVTVSIAAGGDALFGLVGPDYMHFKLPAESLAIGLLIVLNLRGVKESITVLLPIFIVFLVTHAILLVGTIGLHLTDAGDVARDLSSQIQHGANDPKFGLWAMLMLFMRAYSYGAGTYTGIEAVSNSMPVMREPRVPTAKRTMMYMAVSLSLMAGGLMLAYLLMGIHASHDPLKTMNHLLVESFVTELGLDGWAGYAFVMITMIAEGALLFVAAQAGFMDGPRVLANMAHDSWVPHWFGNLSDRLSTHNGILLIGGAALAALWYTDGVVTILVTMYSINVFLTFSLSMIGMCRFWWQQRALANPLWKKRLSLFGFAAVMCVSILSMTIYFKFSDGGWVTIAVTATAFCFCYLIHHHYMSVLARLKRLDSTLGQLATHGEPNLSEPDPNLPTAAILVGGYGGLGVHTMLNSIRFAPGHFKNLIFLSVGVVDSGTFKGVDAVGELGQHTRVALGKYVDLARSLGMPATSFMAVDTDAVEALEQLCTEVSKQFPKAVFFAGQLVFHEDRWYERLLHNQTAVSLQRRLQWAGITMVILPTRVR